MCCYVRVLAGGGHHEFNGFYIWDGHMEDRQEFELSKVPCKVA